MAKRLFDIVLALLALLLLSPVMLAAALAVWLDSGRPVLFAQMRVGRGTQPFRLFKFRSMVVDAEARLAALQASNEMDGPVFKIQRDPRITRVGRWLRRTSLDELPQLLNVLAGQMSLVGPRPHAIGMKTGDTESARLVADYAHRHRIKPGMTGWAAIQGSRGPLHSEADVRRRVQLDIDYVERQSVWLDLWILLVTVPVLLGDRAAVR